MEKNLPIIRHCRVIKTKVTEWYRDTDGLMKFKTIKDETVFEDL